MNCLSYDQMDRLLGGIASPEAMLEHIAQCDVCAEALALRTVQLPCAEAPRGLYAGALAKTRAAGRRESLRSYSLRVLAAMAAALILLFSGAFRFLVNLPEELPKLGASIQSITEKFDFTDFAAERH